MREFSGFILSSSMLAQIGNNFVPEGFYVLDIIIILALAIVFFGYAIIVGREKIVSVVLSIYPTSLIYSSLAFLDKLVIFTSSSRAIFLNKFLIFIILFLVVHFILNKYLSSIFDSSGIVSTALISISATLLFIDTTARLFKLHEFYKLSPALEAYLSAPNYHSIFLILPLILIFFARK